MQMTKLFAISGGGWNSFSQSAGAIAGALDKTDERNIKDILNDYNYIGGNSGGTWFLQSLMGSENFRNSLTDLNSANAYNDKGFNSQVESFFTEVGDQTLIKLPGLVKTILGKLGIPVMDDITVYDTTRQLKDKGKDAIADLVFALIAQEEYSQNWQNFIRSAVFGLHGDYEEQYLSPKLTSQRIESISDNNPIITMAVSGGGLSSYNNKGQKMDSNPLISITDNVKPRSSYNWGYTLTGTLDPTPRTSTVRPYSESFTNKTKNYSAYVPLNFTLDSKNGGMWFTTDGEDLKFNISNDDYSQLPFQFGKKTINKKVGKGGLINADELFPSLVSSSAAAPISSPRVIHDLLKEFAPLGSSGGATFNKLVSSKLKVQSPLAFSNEVGIIRGKRGDQQEYSLKSSKNPLANVLKENWRMLEKNPSFRLADGGFTDNTSVANSLSTADKQGDLKDGFEFDILHNNSESISGLVEVVGVNDTSILMPSDLAGLFGYYSNKSSSLKSPSGLDFIKDRSYAQWTTPNQVFEKDALTNFNFKSNVIENKGITSQTSDPVYRFLELDVKTVSNAYFDIPAGIDGKVKLISTLHPGSNAQPKYDYILEDYKDNYDEARNFLGSDQVDFF